MKQLLLIVVFMLGLGSNAQSPIIPIQGSGERSEVGAYYKDIDNVFDKFVGTWKYQNGNKSLTIILKKKSSYYDSKGDNYIDMLVGEYKYVDENGIELINTLSNLNLVLQPYENNIGGTLILDVNLPASLRRVELYFNDPEREYLNKSIRIKHIDSPGNLPDKIEIKWTGDAIVLPNEDAPINLRVPQQDYILTKQ